MLCHQGLVTTGAGVSAIDAIETFRQRLLRMEGGTDSVLDAATEAPECALLQIYAAIFWLYAGSRAGNTEALKWIARAEQSIAAGTDREKFWLEACRRWQDGDPEDTIERLEEITRRYPRDTVAAKACEYNYYITGQHFQAQRFLGHIERVAQANDRDPDVLAMHSFAHELCGHYEEARRAAEKAIELRFATPWAHHALSHIALMTNDLERGRREQEDFLSTWTNPGPSIHGHNAWHLALLRLETGDRAGCHELYETLIWGHLPTSKGEQTDAISLLWRLEMAGEEIPPERWQALAQACAPVAAETISPFAAAHRGYAFARTEQTDNLRRLRAAAADARTKGTPARRQVWREAGQPTVEASIAAGQANYRAVAAALLPAVDEIPRIGGSDAQGDLWREALAYALAKLGRVDERRKVLTLFPGSRNES